MLHHNPDPKGPTALYCMPVCELYMHIFCHYFTFLIIVWNSIVALCSAMFVLFQWDAVQIRTRWTRGDKMRLTTKTCWESIILSMFSPSSGMFPENELENLNFFDPWKKKKADPNAKTVEVFLEACAMCYYFHVKVLDHLKLQNLWNTMWVHMETKWYVKYWAYAIKRTQIW